jgi:hypothetical protein
MKDMQTHLDFEMKPEECQLISRLGPTRPRKRCFLLNTTARWLRKWGKP